MTSNELRRKYIDFFKLKGHKEIKSASLIPENDPSVLFTTAGMHPLIPYLLGEKHPCGTRLVDVQKCIRTKDINDVGDNRHLTFFEMLGNWSLGDYFKKESIEWSFEFLTDKEIGLGLDPKRLYFTIFNGEDNIPRDEESISCWQNVLRKNGLDFGVAIDGIVTSGVKIIPLGTEDNFWIAGDTGPCGADTEIFYDLKPEYGIPNKKFKELVNDSRFVEIWNNVFMEFNKTEDGQYIQLEKKNVDTGMGIERTITAVNNKETPFETDAFSNAISELEKISHKQYKDYIKEFRIIVDHIKAATFIIGDENGIIPSNKDQGYVLRRLIRRAIRYGRTIGISTDIIFSPLLANVYINQYKDVYPEIESNKNIIFIELEKEEKKFKETLENGLKEFEKIIAKNNKISGVDAFYLYQSFGFPIEITEELAKEKGATLDINEFKQEQEKHREISKAGAEKKFKGGLADNSYETTKLHTAAHLLIQALRIVLGNQVAQRGANITSERLRLDFSYKDKMTEEQIKKVENIVNEQIMRKLDVKMEEMSLEQAEESGAMGVFKDRYGEIVKVYTIGDFSKEICGGPHVKNTGELGHFKIQKEESCGSGVRRIRAILE
ncbi:alanine--tRNA ligase [Patescibacteria group bacterium]|nr:alanine--tRNA ligase [Patescibacteria group bacterium]